MQDEYLVQKPKQPPSDYAITGRYIISHKIFSYLEKTAPDAKGEIQLTDAIKLMISDGYGVYCIEIQGKRYDAGDPAGWLQTISELSRETNGNAY